MKRLIWFLTILFATAQVTSCTRTVASPKQKWCAAEQSLAEERPFSLTAGLEKSEQIKSVQQAVDIYKVLANGPDEIPAEVRSIYADLNAPMTRLRDRINSGELLETLPLSDPDLSEIQDIEARLDTAPPTGCKTDKPGPSTTLTDKIGYTQIKPTPTT